MSERLNRLDTDIWEASAPQTFFGLHLGTRMTVVRLSDGGVLLYSPVGLTPDLRAEVEAIGPVKHIVAPNIGHHLYAGEWKDAYPDATLYAARGLQKRRPDLAIDELLDATSAHDWSGDLTSRFVGGTMLRETVFVHKRSGTLITADLVENFTSSPHWLTKAYLRLGGIHGKPGLSYPLRLAFRDRKVARDAIDQILSWDFDRITLAHGGVLESGGKQALEQTYAWLKS